MFTMEFMLFLYCIIQPPFEEAGLDTVVLRRGGKLHGTTSIIKDEDNGRSYVLLTKPSGAVLKLDQARLVRSVEKFDSVDAKYQSQLRSMQQAGESAAAHRKLIEWCQDQKSGRKRFADEIRYHAQRVIDIEPDDESARRILGYDRDDDGHWNLKDQVLRGHGYVRDGTSWVPAATLEREEAKADLRSDLGDRKENWGRWLRAARRGSDSVPELQRQLIEFCDALAVDIVFKGAQKETDPAIRLMCVEAIGRVSSEQALGSLVALAVTDPNVDVREHAVVQLSQPHYDQAYAARRLTEFFASKNNRWLQNAAFAIGELEGNVAVPDLINHLVTTQTVKISNQQPGAINSTFRSDGGTGFSTGGGPTTAQVNRANPRVLNALKKLTGQDFDLDADRWMDWYIQSNTHHGVNVRADP